MIEFYWPATPGEWLAFLSAAITVFFGLLLLLFPRWSLRLLRLQTRPDVPEAVSEARGTMAGFYLGLGVCCILFAQPFLYLALGTSWAATGFGRFVAMLFDRANTPFNWISLPIELALAAAPLAHVFGYVG
jgi:uncharacterized membrane protein HdeD (DUF308 family)